MYHTCTFYGSFCYRWLPLTPYMSRVDARFASSAWDSGPFERLNATAAGKGRARGLNRQEYHVIGVSQLETRLTRHAVDGACLDLERMRRYMWVMAACGSALFAGLVAILGKLGVQTTDPDVATAVRTCVVLALAWVAAACAGSIGSIGEISPHTWLFLVLSGLATGGSWICYFKALSMGDVNKVVPIDKSSTVLATLLAIVLFGETNNLALKLAATAAILAGTLMMVERKSAGTTQPGSSRWLAYAVLAAVFAALTAILGKVGIDGVESNLGTAIRTCVVLAASWCIVAGRGKLRGVRAIKHRELAFLVLSGLATGASWLCYYYAIQAGVVSAVVQIDKLSIVVSIVFSGLVFGERLSRKALCGLALIVAGTVAITAFA